MTRTAAQVGAANRTRGKDTERKVAAYLHAAGLGDGRRNLAGYARDHGDYGPVTDVAGDRWVIEVKGWADPTPAKVEAAAREAAREAEHACAPMWVVIVRRPGCADVARWWAYVPLWALWWRLSLVDGNRPYPADDLARLTLRAWVALVAPSPAEAAP